MSKLRPSQINSRQESNENGDIKSKMILSSRGKKSEKAEHGLLHADQSKFNGQDKNNMQINSLD